MKSQFIRTEIVDVTRYLWQLSEFWLDIPWHSGIGTRDERPAPECKDNSPTAKFNLKKVIKLIRFFFQRCLCFSFGDRAVVNELTANLKIRSASRQTIHHT